MSARIIAFLPSDPLGSGLSSKPLNGHHPHLASKMVKTTQAFFADRSVNKVPTTFKERQEFLEDVFRPVDGPKDFSGVKPISKRHNIVSTECVLDFLVHRFGKKRASEILQNHTDETLKFAQLLSRVT